MKCQVSSKICWKNEKRCGSTAYNYKGLASMLNFLKVKSHERNIIQNVWLSGQKQFIFNNNKSRFFPIRTNRFQIAIFDTLAKPFLESMAIGDWIGRVWLYQIKKKNAYISISQTAILRSFWNELCQIVRIAHCAHCALRTWF